MNVKVADGGVQINNAKVIKTDIGCSNGVIPVIDTVLLPPTTPKAPTESRPRD